MGAKKILLRFLGIMMIWCAPLQASNHHGTTNPDKGCRWSCPLHFSYNSQPNQEGFCSLRNSVRTLFSLNPLLLAGSLCAEPPNSSCLSCALCDSTIKKSCLNIACCCSHIEENSCLNLACFDSKSYCSIGAVSGCGSTVRHNCMNCAVGNSEIIKGCLSLSLCGSSGAGSCGKVLLCHSRGHGSNCEGCLLACHGKSTNSACGLTIASEEDDACGGISLCGSERRQTSISTSCCAGELSNADCSGDFCSSRSVGVNPVVRSKGVACCEWAGCNSQQRDGQCCSFAGCTAEQESNSFSLTCGGGKQHKNCGVCSGGEGEITGSQLVCACEDAGAGRIDNSCGMAFCGGVPGERFRQQRMVYCCGRAIAGPMR